MPILFIAGRNSDRINIKLPFHVIRISRIDICQPLEHVQGEVGSSIFMTFTPLWRSKSYFNV